MTKVFGDAAAGMPPLCPTGCSWDHVLNVDSHICILLFLPSCRPFRAANNALKTTVKPCQKTRDKMAKSEKHVVSYQRRLTLCQGWTQIPKVCLKRLFGGRWLDWRQQCLPLQRGPFITLGATVEKAPPSYPMTQGGFHFWNVSLIPQVLVDAESPFYAERTNFFPPCPPLPSSSVRRLFLSLWQLLGFDLTVFPSSVLKVAINKVFTDEVAQWEERSSKRKLGGRERWQLPLEEEKLCWFIGMRWGWVSWNGRRNQKWVR